MSYDRRANSFPVWLPAEADEHASKAYLTLHSFKAACDKMEEIPNSLMPFYKQCLKALDLCQKFQAETYQLRMMVKKLPR